MDGIAPLNPCHGRPYERLAGLALRLAYLAQASGPRAPVDLHARDRHRRRDSQPPQAHLYLSEEQLDFFAGRIIFRARSGDTMNLVPAVREAVKSADPQAGIYRVLRLEDEARGSIWRLSYSTLLLTGIALLAALLAVLGVYGVLSYVVPERTQEIGVRMALGAERSAVIAVIVGQGLWLVGGGVVIGLFAAAALTKLLSGLLFGVTPFDPATFVGVAAFLLFAGGIASYVPARRATDIDPLIAMRH